MRMIHIKQKKLDIITIIHKFITVIKSKQIIVTAIVNKIAAYFINIQNLSVADSFSKIKQWILNSKTKGLGMAVFSN
jgi:hypothetical protein